MNLHYLKANSGDPLGGKLVASVLISNALFNMFCYAFAYNPWNAAIFAAVSMIAYPLMGFGRLFLLQKTSHDDWKPALSVPLSRADFAARRISSSSRVSRILKRVADVFVAGVLLVVFAPLMAVVSSLIWLDDGGPIVIRQRRVGLNGRTFDMLKFRSMHVNAEGDGVARFTAEHDRRISGIGRVIRRHRIDELPQLFNILKGEMSLVGPRPERPAFVQEAGARSPHYDARHLVVPGMTGWAQINYPYGDSIEDVIAVAEYDIYYISNWSLLFDVSIFLRTTYVVVFGVGAR